MIKLIIHIIIIIVIVMVAYNLVTTEPEYIVNVSKVIEPVLQVVQEHNDTEPIYHDTLVPNITDNIKLLYLKNVRSVRFIKYNGRYYAKTNGKDIYINLTGDLSVDKVIFCHELIHTIFWSSDIDLDEEIARDLSRQLVCYKK